MFYIVVVIIIAVLTTQPRTLLYPSNILLRRYTTKAHSQCLGFNLKIKPAPKQGGANFPTQPPRATGKSLVGRWKVWVTEERGRR